MTTQFTLTYHDHYITYKLTQHGYCYKYDSLTNRQVRISIETFWKAHKKVYGEQEMKRCYMILYEIKRNGVTIQEMKEIVANSKTDALYLLWLEFGNVDVKEVNWRPC